MDKGTRSPVHGRLPLRTVIVLLFVLLAVLPASLVGYISYRNGREAAGELSRVLRGEIVARVAQRLDAFLESTARLNRFNITAAEEGVLRLGDPDAAARFFWRQEGLAEGVGTVGFANAAGELTGVNRAERYVVLSARRVTGGSIRRYAAGPEGGRTANVLSDRPYYDARTRNWFLTAVNAGRPTWTPVSVSATGMRLDLTAVAPWTGPDNTLRGVFMVDVSLSQLNEFLSRIPVGRTGQLLVTERDGNVVASSTGEKPFLASPGSDSPMRMKASESGVPMIRGAARFLAGIPGGPERIDAPVRGAFELGGRRYFLESVPFRKEPGIDWIITVVLPESDFMGPVSANNRATVALALLALTIAAASGWATARWVTRPIVALNASARSLADGTWDRPVPVDRDDEVGELARSFNDMAVRLRGSIDVLNKEMLERLRVERTLRESEEKYRTLFEESRDMVFFSTPEGTMLDVNAAGIRMLGFPSKEALLGVHVARDLYVDPNERKALIDRLSTQGEVNDFQASFRRHDGGEIQVSVTASAIRNSEGQFVAMRGIVRDVTEHHLLEQQLRQAQKMEAVGQLAGGIAHDFNNILTAIIGFANLLEARLPEGDPLAEYPHNIAASAEKASELTRGLLAFSRKQVLNMRPVDLDGLLGGMTPLLRRLIREDIDLETRLCGEETTVMADPLQVEQVVMNLVTNACDAMAAGGRLTIATGRLGGNVLLTVADTGVGMAPETKDRIFDPFFTTKEVGKGTGLGLAMVYGIVRQHKGQIAVLSEPGRGTSITISLQACGRTVAEPAVAATSAGPMEGHETILVAEDDETLRDLVKEMLERYGYEVLLARDGQEALEIYRAEAARIDMLLIDLVMPRMNGRDFHAAAKALNPSVRALFYSGYTADLAEPDTGFEPGGNLLSKPFSINDLARKVRRILDGPA
jgi:PAS domain S-box-containing protein